MAQYRAAYKALDDAKIKAMNPLSSFKRGQFNSADVTFENVNIQPREDGQSAVLHATANYLFGFRRGDPQTTSARVVWRMRRTPAGWIVEK
jgi:hypothetical protein